MEYWVRGEGPGRFIEFNPDQIIIAGEADGLDLIGICMEHGTERVMLHAGNLPGDFFDLKTGLAGVVLQKFVNYGIQAAAVIPMEIAPQHFPSLSTRIFSAPVSTS